MKMLNKIFAVILIFGIASSATAYSTLWDYFVDTQGWFPSIEEREVIAGSYGIENYEGTAQQNIYFLTLLDTEGISVDIPDSLRGNGSLVLGAFNPSGGGTYRLKNSIGTTDTSIPLSSFKEPVSNIPYTMSYLNTTIAYGTVDPSTTRSEFVSFSGITQNSDGSATLTGATRGLTRSPAGSACTASTTLAQRHPGQSVFILSDSPCLFQEYAVKRNDESITGEWTVIYPTASSSIASRGYVLDTVNSSTTLSFDKIAVGATAGENLDNGNLVYLSAADGRWYKASASTTERIFGIAQATTTAGVAIGGGVIVAGLDSTQSSLTSGTPTLTAGASYYASSTSAGDITTATTTLSVGIARSITQLYFSPRFAEQPTIQEKQALIKLASSTQSYATTTTATTTYTVTLSPIPTQYSQGMIVRFPIMASSTASSTLNVNSLGAKSIVNSRGSSTTDNTLLTGDIAEVVYDGNNFRLTSNDYSWEPLVDFTATSTIATTTLPQIPNRRFFRVHISTPIFAANNNVYVLLNADHDANYTSRYSKNGAADTTGVSQRGILIRDSDNTSFISTIDIHNPSTNKVVYANTAEFTGTGSAPDRFEIAGAWNNTGLINRIDIGSDGLTGGLPVDTRIIIYGSKY